MDLPRWCDTHADQVEVTKFGDKTRSYVDGIVEYSDNVIDGLVYHKTGGGWGWSWSNHMSFTLAPLERSLTQARISALDFISTYHHDHCPEAIMIKTAMEVADEET